MSGEKPIFDPKEHQHVRYNPLKGDWVLVSPHRMKRPWGGQMEPLFEEDPPEYDPKNPLCPGNVRANGEATPKYEHTYSFPNDFPALLEDVPTPPNSEDELFQMEAARGSCRVMCFHPKSNVTIALMNVVEIKEVISQWINEMIDLGKKWTWVQIFENRGALMGCSNAHPHCQIWSSSYLPNEARVKDEKLRDYFYRHQSIPLLMNYVKKELARRERIVLETPDWVVVVPYWAVWPYETMVLPKRQMTRMEEMTEKEQLSLAVVMKVLCTKYDNLFQCSFPYSMGWHGAPTGECRKDYRHWTFHGIYYPPLLRSATIKKHMVGYELLAQAQRDLTPEQAAEKLRFLPSIHYKHPETSLTPEQISNLI